jgi:hypothetical protein
MYADFQVIFSSKTFKKTANIRIFNAFFERIWAETMDEKMCAGVLGQTPKHIPLCEIACLTRLAMQMAVKKYMPATAERWFYYGFKTFI